MAKLDTELPEQLADWSVAEAVDRLLLSQRLANFSAGARLMLVAGTGTLVGVTVAFREIVPLPALLAWGAVQALLLAASGILQRGFDRASASYAELRQHWSRCMAMETIRSISWAVITIYLAFYVTGNYTAVLTAITVANLCVVLIVHRTAPYAAAVRLGCVGIASAAAMYIYAGTASLPAILLLALFIYALAGSVREQDMQLIHWAEVEVDRSEASGTVRMLLNDYEEQSSDWLWTVDPGGSLLGVSERFAAAAGRRRERLEGMPLLDLFMPGPDLDQLAQDLRQREPFRGHVVRLAHGDAVSYWELSARPRPDGRMSGVARDVTGDRLTEERVAFMAHYDNLTGLANRYLFNERLREALEDEARARDLALFYLDLDDFKAVNDTRGHLVGDRLLREVGNRLEGEMRGGDLVARLGGDEFAVLLETRSGAGMLIERAHRFLAVIRQPLELDDQVYRISGSIGIAHRCDDRCDAEELMRRADLALFAAKDKGRDTIALFNDTMDRQARERREIEADLREALSRGQLRLHYQPTINLDSGEVCGYEALLRWYHPTHGLVSPAKFLEVAEETGLIVPIGEWVIREALSETSQWEGNFRIAINLSPTQVASPYLADVVSQALHAHEFDPRRVEFEITEHVLMQKGTLCASNLDKLRELGVQIALDDFGIGYSSLSYLRSFPFDRIKIDRSFVVGIERESESQAIVSSITRLADALGMATTAEGIETREQLDLLRKLGCHEAQGYLICAPIMGDRFRNSVSIQAALEAEESGVIEYRKARDAILRSRQSQLN